MAVLILLPLLILHSPLIEDFFPLGISHMERIRGVHKVYKVGNHSIFENKFFNLKGNDIYQI